MFYRWLLPVLWGTVSYLHHMVPGDEHGLWLLSSAAGSWISPVLFLSHVSKPMMAWAIAGTGAVVMMGVGALLDRWRVNRGVWLVLQGICSVIILVLMIASYPSIKRAISKNGSWSAYLCSSFLLGMYVSVILASVVTGAVRCFRGTTRAMKAAD